MTRVTFEAYAALECSGALTSWSYEPRPLHAEDVEIQITHCGVCGGDLHNIDDDWKMSTFPLVPGHEIVGLVVQKGTDVSHLQVGDRVGVGAQAWSCDVCHWCQAHQDQLCPHTVYTYGSKYPDGQTSYGGFANFVRVSSRYTFKLPEKLPSIMAAPLLCAGTTIYRPLKKYAATPGSRVGIVGIGGLGHLAIQFARAMGHKVTAISHSMNKKQESIELGASTFIHLADQAEVASAKQSLDVLLFTASFAHVDWNALLSFMAPNGVCVLLGLPREALQIPPTKVVFQMISIVGSQIDSRHEIPEMLNFAVKHHITPQVETFKMSQVNEVIAKVRAGQIKYRAVLLQE